MDASSRSSGRAAWTIARGPARRGPQPRLHADRAVVVIRMIGILAAIACRAFLNQRSEGRRRGGEGRVGNARTTLETFHTDRSNSTTPTPPTLKDLEPALNDAREPRVTGSDADLRHPRWTADGGRRRRDVLDRRSTARATSTRSCTQPGRGRLPPAARTPPAPLVAALSSLLAHGRPWDGRRLHFVGIGGAGMSGLALAAQELGAEVTGSDRSGGSPYARAAAGGGDRAAHRATTPRTSRRAPRSSSRPRSRRRTPSAPPRASAACGSCTAPTCSAS